MTKRKPKELGPEPADTTGKEIERVRDWDKDTLTRAIAAGQRDIIETELDWLLRLPAWQQQAKRLFGYQFTGIPADIAQDTLALCRLDNIPVTYDDDTPAEHLVETHVWPLINEARL